MNDEHIQKSERIASHVMRGLAIAGLVAILALAAWLVVQGVRHAAQANSGLTAAVNAVTSIVKPAPEERIAFDLDTHTLTVGQSAIVRWTHDAPPDNAQYAFSYSCNRDVVLTVDTPTGWKDVACGTNYATDVASVTIRPTSPLARFADIELTVTSGAAADTTLVTIVNTEADITPVASTSDTQNQATGPENVPATTTVSTATEPKPVVTTMPVPVAVKPQAPAVKPPVYVAPVPPAPSDLAVNLVATGVYVKVAEKYTFFPMTTIPSDKRAGVAFTVTNRGGQPSGAWAFIAHVPTSGDLSYKYTSPAQTSLTPGMQVEFTLGFDDLPKDQKGLIKIEVVPTSKTDLLGNNLDAIAVVFK